MLRQSGGADGDAGDAGTWPRNTSLLWLTLMTCVVVWHVRWLMEGVGMLRVPGETRVHSVCTHRRENQFEQARKFPSLRQSHRCTCMDERQD